MGKKLFFFRKGSRRRLKKIEGPPPTPLRELMPLLGDAASQHNNNNDDDNYNNNVVAAAATGKEKKKAGGARLWMRLDRVGNSELVECDKNAIIKRVAIPARDLRILGPLFSNASNILAREKAIVVNLEFIRAIVTAEEVLILDPLNQEVIPFVDQLRQQLPHKSTSTTVPGTSGGDGQDNGMNDGIGARWLPSPEAAEGLQSELPFEFQVLEIALEAVCTFLDSSVADMERNAYAVLDELARNVSTKNLEYVRSLKSNLTGLLARVQKVRDEIEHLLDDNEDMADLYLTRKRIQIQQSESALGATGSNSVITLTPNVRRVSSYRSASIVTSLEANDVEELEMLLEVYFMQLDGTRNKILSVREYIDDTEDYVNIQLDNQRNELIQLQLILSIAAVSIAAETVTVGMFSMNIPCPLYGINGIFGDFVGGTLAACFLLFFLLLGYARWKKLLGS